MKEYIARRVSAVHVIDATGNEVPSDLLNSLGISLITNEAVQPPTLGPAIADRTYVVGSAPVTIDLSQRFIGAISYGMTPTNIPGVTRSGAIVTIDPATTRATTAITVSGTNTAGTATMAFNLTVNAVSPTLTTPLPDRSLTVGDAAVTLALGEYFANATAYSVSPTGQGVSISGSTLTISAAAERNGTYTVTASNSTGQTVIDAFALVVAAAVTAPSPFVAGDWTLATGLEANQLVVSVNTLPANGGSPITAIQYSANNGTWTPLGGAGTGARTLTMPAAGTSYSVRLRAVNAAGNSTPSDTKTEMSGAEAPVLRPEYLGAVATGARISTTTSTTNKQFNSRSHHVARDTISGIRIELPAWWWQRKTSGTFTQYREHPAGGPITYSAAIEYPEGTFTPVLFGGVSSADVAGGNSILSDMAAVSIPNGASFWVRTYSTSAWGIIFEDGDSGVTTVIDKANGEAMEYAASGVVNKTMGGTIVDNNAAAGPIFRPTAIVAMTRQPTFLLTGDSKAWGFGDTPTAGGDAGELERLIGPNYGYINTGSSGDWLNTFRDFGTRRAALQQYTSHVVVQAAINSLRSGGSGQNKTAAAVLAEQQQVLAMFPNKTRIVTTTAPQSASSNSWADQAGQTVNANSAQVIAFNDAVRAGVANSIGYIDLADAAEPTRNAGKWKTNGTAFAFTRDGLHPTPLGYSQVNSLELPDLTYVAP